MLDVKPNLTSYSRASYYRELSGDTVGAIEAMRLAASAGGAPENTAYVQVLLGDLELQRGRIGSARQAYVGALRSMPDYPAGLVGLARADAASGDLGRAAARLRRAVTRLPLISTLGLLAQVERRLGHPAAAAAALDTARAQQGLFRAAATAPDAESVLFAADHGPGTAAVALGKRVWAAAPSVRSADALGWALTRAGRPAAGYRWALRALALGSRDASFRLHAGIAARRAGLAAAAARHLAIAASARPALTPDGRALLRGGRTMRALLLGLAAALTVALTVAPRADAHPLGNFSVNHLSVVSVSDDRVDVRYVLDQAEIPTVQEDQLSRAEVLGRKSAEVERRLVLTVDGRRVALVPAGSPVLRFPAGAGGLRTTRLELPLRARVDDPRRVELHDGTFPGRIGWKAVVSRPGDGTAVRTRAPSGDPTDGLRRYPQDLLSSPLDERSATFQVEPGDGTLVAPDGARGGEAETRAASDGFAGLFADAASGRGVLLVLLPAAFGWGALHALSPGHGKAMVAAYLVGTRGRPRHAVALGATVTVTHTIGVFALGVVTLALSQYVLPEDLYPWLTLTSGLLVVTVGLGVLRARARRARRARTTTTTTTSTT